jgi:hypothetical protein
MPNTYLIHTKNIQKHAKNIPNTYQIHTYKRAQLVLFLQKRSLIIHKYFFRYEHREISRGSGVPLHVSANVHTYVHEDIALPDFVDFFNTSTMPAVKK